MRHRAGLRSEKRAATLYIVLGVLVLTGCAAIRNTTGQPPRPATPYEQALAGNVILADTNRIVQEGIIAAEQVKLLPTAYAAKLISETRGIAIADKEITAILAAGSDSAAKQSDRLRLLFAQIQASAARLVASGALGVKNPNSQQVIQAEVNAIAVLAIRIVDLLAQSGVLK